MGSKRRPKAPEWSTEPIVEQLARLGAGYRGGWPDEATRKIVMGAVEAATVRLRQKLASCSRARLMLKAQRDALRARSENPQ